MKKNSKITVALIVFGAFAIIGLVSMLVSRAAGPFLSAEPETGTITAPAASINDALASGGKSVQFKTGSSQTFKPLTPGTSWQWQLTGTIDTNILDSDPNPKKMFDIDVYDTPVTTITTLKNKGIVVVCYFSAGSSEDWRSDYSSFPESVKGNPLDSWPGEKWLDIRQISILSPIMAARMDLAVTKGCDGLEPDNVDGYTNNTGFPLTATDQINYLKELAKLAHARNLSIGLKNNVDQIAQLQPTFDWALNEQCYQYNECDGYSAFINANKAVFGVEYKGATTTFCPKANAANYDWLLKSLNLGATPRTACR